MFEGFREERIYTGEATIHFRHGGQGPPLLLLHGIPETHLMWHRVAAQLAEDFTVVATDLRGYGASSKPPSAPDHSPYSKRSTARDQVEVMRRLGHSRFGVAGHDRGGRCAYRLAIDHPDRVTKLAALDIVPTADMLRRVDLEVARGIWVWLLLSQPYDVPERIVGAAPQAFVDHMLDTWSGEGARFLPAVRAAYVEAFRDPATVHAICEEYRASIGIDRELDEADRKARPIRCPVLALWSREGLLKAWGDVLAVWREWAADVRGRPLDCGHFLAEEAPDETAAELRAFFSS